MVYTSKDHAYNHETIYEKCKNHTITLLLVKSSTNKIMGGLIPVKLQNYNGWSSVLPDNSSLVFFYDDNKLRQCP